MNVETPITSHPAYDQLVYRYRTARRFWAASPGIRQAAAILSMSERAYCDGYVVNQPPLTWTGSSSVGGTITQVHCDVAFGEAEP